MSESDSPSVTPNERRRLAVRLSTTLALLLVAGAATAFGLRGVFSSESTDDAFVEGHLVYLSPRVTGQVVEVLVEENQPVRAGDLLVRIDPSDYEVRLAHARADLDAARNRMVQAQAAAAAAAAQTRAAEARLRHAERELARARGLFERGAGSHTALDAALAERDAAEAEVRAGQQRETAERAVLGNEAPVRQAEAAVREAELGLEWTAVVAPFDGHVGRKSVEVGATVAPGQPLLTLVDDTESWVVANFKETQIGRMAVGDRVHIDVDAFPDRRFVGHVESISPATGAKYALIPPDNATGNFTKVVQRVPVRIALDAVEGGPRGEELAALPIGLSVNVRVSVR
jgi:membrane fusion protein (multidrug efflux system)